MPITKIEQVQPDRLTWPEAQPRAAQRIDGTFKTALDKAEREIENELVRWGATRFRISRVRQRIYASGVDQGVALWWVDRKGDLKVLACDRYRTMASNAWAIYLTLDAMRALDRWGAYTIEQASEGAKVKALPPPAGMEQIDWRVVFTMPLQRYGDLAVIEQLAIANSKYRTMASFAHDDEAELRRLNLAIEAARKELAP